METTRELACYLVKSKPDHIPENARCEAVRSLLNWVGCAIGGAYHEAVDRSLSALAELSMKPQATILGRPERLDLLHSTLINGMSSHVLDFDDTHLRSLLHASGPIIPALLAMSEVKPIDGQRFLHAFILGVEIESRIANAICHNHNADWYITGTVGPFGAAAAVGKVMNLDEQHMTWALGIAATLGAGLREMGGTMSNSLIHGRAGQNGLYAAMLAAKGFTGSEHGLEGARGFAKVIGGITDTSLITAGLGETYEITLNTYKPFACGVVAHPVIDGCIRLRSQYNIKPSDLSHVALRVHPQALKLTGIRNPRSGLDSKWSIFHSAAVALVRGAAGEHEYTDACVFDPEIARLRESIQAITDSSLRQDEAHVTLTLHGGGVLTQYIEHALGSAENPLSRNDLESKFSGLVDGVLSQTQKERLMELCWSVTELNDVAEISRQSVPNKIDN
jgi:2-methylcitrate dehydratase PrpD